MQFILVLFLFISSTISSSVNKQCRELLSCSIKKECVKLEWLVGKVEGKEISAQMYNDIDTAVDYGCIFTTGCQTECNKCPLCMASKLQVVDILGGTDVTDDMDCHDLLKCASKCVETSVGDINTINHCLRHTCAVKCFDGTCPKCSAFVTRIFNQICVAGEFRKKVKSFKGVCHEMFRDIVYAKFRTEFDKVGMKPAIGKHATQ